MKEFKIAKCVDKNGKGIHEYAIFADGSRKKRIYTDDKYGKYFKVDNELNQEEETCLRYSFSGRIKDAVDMIRNGNGDCIRSTNLLGRHDYLLYFIDRKVGEKLRQEFLKSLKYIEFAWIIKTGYKNSFHPYTPLNIKDEAISVFDDNKIPMYFKYEDEAYKHIKILIDKAWKYAKQLQEDYHKKADNEQNKDKIIGDWMDKIRNETSEFNIVLYYASDMLDEKENLKFDKPLLDKWDWRIEQCIIK